MFGLDDSLKRILRFSRSMPREAEEKCTNTEQNLILLLREMERCMMKRAKLLQNLACPGRQHQ